MITLNCFPNSVEINPQTVNISREIVKHCRFAIETACIRMTMANRPLTQVWQLSRPCRDFQKEIRDRCPDHNAQKDI